MRLSQLQRTFQARVLNGTRGIESCVHGGESLEAEARIGVYEHAFTARLIEALAGNYPAVRHALGEDDFAHLTRAFVAAAPPSHFSIRYFGTGLGAFIASEIASDIQGVKGKVLGDLARWEWALGEAFDAADEVALTPAELAHVEPDRWGELRFRLSSTLRRVCLCTNAVQWWRAASQGTPRPTRWRSAKPVEWAIWRAELATYFRSMPADEARALDAIAEGQSFASMCEDLAQSDSDSEASLRAATLLQRWLKDRWIVRCDC